jgi:four helix bundle protein
MENSGDFNFNNHFCHRTKTFALSVCKLIDTFSATESINVIKKQLIRSGTSLAANFRAASRARSTAEYYSKICIVVEETDESLFWIEMLEDLIKTDKQQLISVKTEVTELLKVFSTTKKNLKSNKK